MVIQKQFKKKKLAAKIKNIDGISADGTQSIFDLIILGKINELTLKFSQGSVAVL